MSISLFYLTDYFLHNAFGAVEFYSFCNALKHRIWYSVLLSLSQTHVLLYKVLYITLYYHYQNTQVIKTNQF